ncbi:GMF-gamma [Intoshia linei]|uniref:GMF-gamma n=1 Tax=Intoshia linei TaxID=1819745 RepID=A0A177AY93_9BILA|nr:GMF-gamma [Intoshia linei]
MTTSQTISMCKQDEYLMKSMRKFRFNKSQQRATLIVKIENFNTICVDDEFYNNEPIEEIMENLNENEPRFIVHSFELVHNDGRKSYPIILIYYSPVCCNTNLIMVYTSCIQEFSHTYDLHKTFNTHELDEIDEQYLINQLIK